MPDLPLVRVRLKYPDVDTLVERFAPNVTRGGIFLASRDPKPVGTQIRFEVSLIGGTCVLAGEGRVTWVKPFDATAPTRPHGMGVSFTRLDSESRDMFRRLVERREIGAARKTAAPPPPSLRGVRTTRDLVAPDLEGMDDLALRRAADRARALTGDFPGGQDVDALLVAEPEAPANLSEALAGLARYLPPRRSLTPARPTPAVTAADINRGNGRPGDPASDKDDLAIDIDLDDKR